MRVLVVLAALAGCTRVTEKDYLSYAWDDRDILCSDAIDDIAKPVNWPFIERELKQAGDDKWALMLHAHTPGVTVSMDAIERVLDDADADGLDYVTFSELVPGEHRGALALAFDDNAPDQWITVAPLLAAHHAHVTFFVTRWNELTAAQHDELHQLAEDGHDLEPHTVHHLHATAYVEQHGLPEYMDDEVLPSIQVLVEAGYHPTSFAYPFGDHTIEIDEAVLRYVARVRTTPGGCPW